VVATTGNRILEGLEGEAARRGAQKVMLNARDDVTEFYAKHDYAVIGEAERFSARFGTYGCKSRCHNLVNRMRFGH